MYQRVKMSLSATFLILGALLTLLPAIASATAPDSVNYQGVLTDAGGVPVADGNYTVTLSIYSSNVGGVALWTETKIVTTNSGLFNTILGSVTPLPSSVFSSPNRFLGTAVSPDAEMTPRTAIVAVPFAHRISTVDGAAGGAISGDVDVSSNSVGNALSVSQSGGGRSGFFQIANGANTEAAVQGTHVGPGAGGSFFSDGGGPGLRASATGGVAAELEGKTHAFGDIVAFNGVDTAASVDVSAGTIKTFGSDGLEQIRLWGGTFGELLLNDNTGNNRTARLSATANSGGQLELGNATGVTQLTLNGGSAGDASANFPIGAINSTETLDEPGVANRIQAGGTSLGIGGGSADILIRTITAPTDGYVIAFASGSASVLHTNGAFSTVSYGIVPPGGTLFTSPKVEATISGNAPSGTYEPALAVSAAFSVTAGAQQFTLAASSGATATVSNSQLTLLFVPTAYGAFTSNAANVANDPMESRDAEREAAKQFTADRIAIELQEMRAKLDALQSQVEENQN